MAENEISSSADVERFVVPLAKTPPTIDGKIDDGEWQIGVGCDGFSYEGDVCGRRVQAWVAATEAATESHIYVAIKSQMPDKGNFTCE